MPDCSRSTINRRLAASMPLLASGLLPISFVDFDRAAYIRAMAAFYELGTTRLFEKVFVEGYVKSIVRSSDIPPAMRAGGFSIEEVARHLLEYVNTGRLPGDALRGDLLHELTSSKGALIWQHPGSCLAS